MLIVLVEVLVSVIHLFSFWIPISDHPYLIFNPFGVGTLYTEDIWTPMGHFVHYSDVIPQIMISVGTQISKGMIMLCSPDE